MKKTLTSKNRKEISYSVKKQKKKIAFLVCIAIEVKAKARIQEQMRSIYLGVVGNMCKNEGNQYRKRTP